VYFVYKREGMGERKGEMREREGARVELKGGKKGS
jgi:hypothetical protein